MCLHVTIAAAIGWTWIKRAVIARMIHLKRSVRDDDVSSMKADDVKQPDAAMRK